jgi:hypothetical protein
LTYFDWGSEDVKSDIIRIADRPAVLPTAVPIDDESAPIPVNLPTTPAPVPPPEPAPAESSEKKKYKVLSQKDMGFAVKFDALKLEETLNRFAAEGWRVQSMITLALPTHGGGFHDEVFVLLEHKSR